MLWGFLTPTAPLPACARRGTPCPVKMGSGKGQMPLGSAWVGKSDPSEQHGGLRPLSEQDHGIRPLLEQLFGSDPSQSSLGTQTSGAMGGSDPSQSSVLWDQLSTGSGPFLGASPLEALGQSQCAGAGDNGFGSAGDVSQ